MIESCVSRITKGGEGVEAQPPLHEARVFYLTLSSCRAYKALIFQSRNIAKRGFFLSFINLKFKTSFDYKIHRSSSFHSLLLPFYFALPLIFFLTASSRFCSSIFPLFYLIFHLLFSCLLAHFLHSLLPSILQIFAATFLLVGCPVFTNFCSPFFA